MPCEVWLTRMGVGGCKALPRSWGRSRAEEGSRLCLLLLALIFLLMAVLIIAAKITDCCFVGTFISP